MKTLLIIFAFVSGIIISGCTDNYMAKNYGGTSTLELQKNRKLVNVTWKDDNLWILTRPMIPGDMPETYQFVEESSYGIMSGTVVIKESR